MRSTGDHTSDMGVTLHGKVATKRELGQFLTPAPIAEFMASMFTASQSEWKILDAGAGAGALTKALVHRVCKARRVGSVIKITAYELDRTIIPALRREYEHLQRQCDDTGISFHATILNADFIECALNVVRRDLFSSNGSAFNTVILNPPYRKINSDSPTRKVLRSAGIETSNLYTGFLALASSLLCPSGELVAITPRSFCNGPYFRAFRHQFLNSMSLRRIHVFESRSAAFSHDSVLQENVIVHAVKSRQEPHAVVVSKSTGDIGGNITSRKCSYDEVVNPADSEAFIHLMHDSADKNVRDDITRLKSSVLDLGVSVSTGRVVDFRATDFLRMRHSRSTVPLIRPCHFDGFFARWPGAKERKPCAIVNVEAIRDLLVPNGYYVLVKRFSAKEERKRIVACVYDPTKIKSETTGFENHLNFLHTDGHGMYPALAFGLAAYLNSTPVDVYFRQFSGHTQVNATDLRSIPFPSLAKLQALGKRVAQIAFNQSAPG